MRATNQDEARQRSDAGAQAEEPDSVRDAHTPRKLSLAENVALAVKIAAIAGGLGAGLWAIDRWVSAG